MNLIVFDIPKELRQPFILTSYRANQDLAECFMSLFRLHNETLNVWLHLIGALGFFGLLRITANTACGSPTEQCPERWVRDGIDRAARSPSTTRIELP